MSFGKAQSSSTAPSPKKRMVRSRFFDARRAGRTRVILPGKLCFGSPILRSVDCVIGDASTRGARVRVKPGTEVPTSLFLVHVRDWTAYEANVVWRRSDGNIGLSFKRSYELQGAGRPELRVMREHCVAYENTN